MDELTQWILRAQQGEPEAWEVLYQRFAGPLFRQAYHLLQDSDEAADVVQEVLLRAYQRRQQIKAPEALAQWLRVVALNECRRRLRRLNSRPPIVSLEELVAGEEEGEGIGADDWSPHRAVERRQLQHQLSSALAQLPTSQREVIVLYHLEGMEVEAIARLVGRPVGTVKSRLARGRDRLRKLLADWEEVIG